MVLHIIFIIIHIGCVLFGFFGLLFSIPLHVLFAILFGNKKTMNKQFKRTKFTVDEEDVIWKNRYPRLLNTVRPRVLETSL